MTDDLAIRLFVRDGGVAGEWHAQDPCTMNHYRKEAVVGPVFGDALLSELPVSGAGVAPATFAY